MGGTICIRGEDQATFTSLPENEPGNASTYFLLKASFRVRVEEILPVVDVVWMVAAKLLGVEEKIEVLRVTRTPPKNW